MKKSLKMAIASSDGKVINQHFGKEKKFIIIESDGEGIKVLEVRQNDPSVEAPGFIEENVLAYAKYRLKDS